MGKQIDNYSEKTQSSQTPLQVKSLLVQMIQENPTITKVEAIQQLKFQMGNGINIAKAKEYYTKLIKTYNPNYGKKKTVQTKIQVYQDIFLQSCLNKSRSFSAKQLAQNLSNKYSIPPRTIERYIKQANEIILKKEIEKSQENQSYFEQCLLSQIFKRSSNSKLSFTQIEQTKDYLNTKLQEGRPLKYKEVKQYILQMYGIQINNGSKLICQSFKGYYLSKNPQSNLVIQDNTILQQDESLYPFDNFTSQNEDIFSSYIQQSQNTFSQFDRDFNDDQQIHFIEDQQSTAFSYDDIFASNIQNQCCYTQEQGENQSVEKFLVDDNQLANMDILTFNYQNTIYKS